MTSVRGKKNRKKHKIDEWDSIIEEIENNREDIWEKEKIYDLSLAQRQEIKLDIESFVTSKQQELEDLEDQLKDWIEKSNQKLLYLKAVEELGREKIQIFTYLNVKYDNKFWPLLAPKGYWNSSKGIVKIEDMEKEINNNYQKNAVNWIQNIKNELLQSIIVQKDNESEKVFEKIINNIVIPALNSKINEFTIGT